MGGSAWIATVGGVGRVPLAPGTAGSLAALPLAALAARHPLWGAVFVLGATPFVARAAARVAAARGEEDPPEVVADEFLGQIVAALSAGSSLSALAAAFVLFRAFDVIKPPPVGEMERLPGGIGIVLDDLAAGLLAASAVVGIRLLFAI